MHILYALWTIFQQVNSVHSISKNKCEISPLSLSQAGWSTLTCHCWPGYSSSFLNRPFANILTLLQYSLCIFYNKRDLLIMSESSHHFLKFSSGFLTWACKALSECQAPSVTSPEAAPSGLCQPASGVLSAPWRWGPLHLSCLLDTLPPDLPRAGSFSSSRWCFPQSGLPWPFSSSHLNCSIVYSSSHLTVFKMFLFFCYLTVSCPRR